MRIRTYITVLILGCGLSALGLFQLAQKANTRVEDIQIKLGTTQLAQSDLSRLEDQFTQWLILGDIVFRNNDPYLIHSGIRVGNNIQALATTLEKGDALSPDKLIPLHEFVNAQLKRLESAIAFSIDDWDSKGIKLLDEMDYQSYAAKDAMDLVRNELNTQKEKRTISLKNAEDDRDRTLILASASFVLIVGILWIFTVFTIIIPIRSLSLAATNSLANDESFDLKPQGPQEIKALNASFRSLVGSLESKVAERTAKHKKAAKDAQAADKAKSEFLASMSHEIRTPMNGIIGMNDIILEHTTDRDTRHYSETVRSSADTLLVLINQILDFSKIDAGQLELESEPFNLRHTLEEVVDLFSSTALSKGVDLFYLLSPSTHYLIEGDSHRLKQVLSNLIGNAVKFTENGTISISTETTAETSDNITYSFQVKDTGIGIPESARKKLFHTFTQAESSTTRKFGGTGLGLAISKNLVQLMDGEIGFDSEVGSGSNFHFTATFKKYDNPTEEKAIREAAALLQGKQAILSLHKAHLVENVTLWLEYWGVKVSTTLEPEDFAKQIAKSTYQLAFLDSRSIETHSATIGSGAEISPEIVLTLLSDSPSKTATKNVEFAQRINHFVTLPFKPISFLSELTQSEFDSHAHSNREALEHPSEIAELRPCAILLVDDNQTNRSVVRSILKRHDLSLDIVTNGREAIKAAAQTAYDVILMDCMMPEMDGYEATTAIRADKTCPNQKTPIIALTANAMSGDREKCLAAGMSDYLSKPIRARSLQTAIANWTSDSPKTNIPTSESSRSADTSKLFDHNSFLDNIGGYDDEMRELLKEFIESATQSATTIQSLCEDGRNANEIAVQSHTLKGCAANVGANALCSIANSIERACATEQIAAIKALIPSLIETLNATIPAIESFIAANPTDD